MQTGCVFMGHPYQFSALPEAKLKIECLISSSLY